MKKGVLFVTFLLFISLFSLVAADVNSTKADAGFACLSQKVSDCTSLSPSEQIFTSLASGECTSQLQSSESSSGCWPGNSCNVKTTAQAMLALHNSGISTNTSETWLLSQEKNTTDINWFLQIDSPSATSCTIEYSGASYGIDITADKKINPNSQNGAGSCLNLDAVGGYWLQVNPSCFGTQFTISCDQSFTTTKLYQRQGGATIYVSSFLNSSGAGGSVTASVNSKCFAKSGSCDYESSLWAALALNKLGYDLSDYLPYLTTGASDSANSPYLPYSFLYGLTSSSDYLQNLLSAQTSINNQNYWLKSGDKYFDTALALLPLKSDTSQGTASARSWVESTQGTDGCWNNGNILDTAFLLYSVYGSRATAVTPVQGCSSSGYYCLSSTTCSQAGGSVVTGYQCSDLLAVCCSQDYTAPTCSSQNGVLCDAGKVCSGTEVGSSDASSGQSCCLGGTCNEPTTQTSICETNGGVCRPTSCNSGEEQTSDSCTLSSDACCMPQPSQSSGNGVVWLVIMIILVFLAVLGIIFRKRLIPIWLKIKSQLQSGFKNKGPGRNGPGPRGPPPRGPFPPGRPSPGAFRPMPQRAPANRASPPRGPARAPPRPKSSSDVNDVLKKLKEMGK